MTSKNQSFLKRIRFACAGVAVALKKEASFRAQMICAVGALLSLLVFQPGLLWASLFVLTIALVLAAELLNTALEGVIDCLHPEVHPLLGLAKDCAAGAVLIASLGSVLIFVLMLVSVYGVAV